MLNVEILQGTKLNAIGRAAAMCWISFGDLIEIESHNGLRTVGQFALDLDCPWRIRCNSKILLASTDMFEPASTHQQDETFEWDIQGHNLFDERIAMLCSKELIITVQSVELSPTNDLKIIFSNNYILEVFVCGSTDVEQWRLFEYENPEDDFVVKTAQNAACNPRIVAE